MKSNKHHLTDVTIAVGVQGKGGMLHPCCRFLWFEGQNEKYVLSHYYLFMYWTVNKMKPRKLKP